MFTADATYRIIGVRDLKGIDEIESYWSRNKSRQANVWTRTESWMAISDSIFLEWRAGFHSLTRHCEYELHGLMWLRCVEDGRIVSLTEAYTKTEGRR